MGTETYRLKAQAGQSAPVDEKGGGTLTGATQTLVDRGSGDWAWQFAAGQAVVAIPAKVFSDANPGATFVIKGRITNYGTADYGILFGFGPTTFGQNAIAPEAPGTAVSKVSNGSVQTYTPTSGGNNMTTPGQAVGNVDFTIVVRLSKKPAGDGGFDRVHVWYNKASRANNDPDLKSGLDIFQNETYSNFTINASNGVVVQLTDAAFFPDEKTDATCAGMADNVRAVLDAAPPTDTTAPTLTSPTGAASGTTTATGSVTTDEANGTLYRVTTTNASETAATVKAGASQPVTAAGVQNVTASGLSSATTYRHHFLHRDAAGNDSAVASSGTFTTSTPGDTTAPTLSAASAAKSGSTGATFSVTTNEANGALYKLFSTNATETAATVKAANNFQAVTATGVQTGTQSGLSAATQYYGHFVHRDAAGNDSAAVHTGAFTTDAASAGGTFKTAVLGYNSQSKWPAGTAVKWQWNQRAGGIGTASTSITNGTGSIASDGTVTMTGLPSGAGDGWVQAGTSVYQQAGTVA